MIRHEKAFVEGVAVNGEIDDLCFRFSAIVCAKKPPAVVHDV